MAALTFFPERFYTPFAENIHGRFLISLMGLSGKMLLQLLVGGGRQV